MTHPMPEDWVGRSQESEDSVPLQAAWRLAATLDLDPQREVPEIGAPLPPLWHWLAFGAAEPTAALGSDGHPERGDFLPPVQLERRMWAGGRLVFHAPIPIGAPLHRRSEISAVSRKRGAAGEMVFVTVKHCIDARGIKAIEEIHDIVYVARPGEYAPPAPVAAPEGEIWRRSVHIDPVRLFRFSAVTFNAHRIHYDLDYVRKAECYPGLVVHGPLQALLLLSEARRRAADASAAAFSFRSVRPLFHTDVLHLLGSAPEGADQALHAVTDGNLVTMRARVSWR